MRLLIVLLISLSSLSCKLDMDDDSHFEKIAAYNIQIPDSCNAGSVVEIPFDYKLPNGCYQFYNIEFEEPNGLTQIITPFAIVSDSPNCTMEYREETYNDLEVTLTHPGTYTFKFWIGQSNSGESEYEEHILVVN